MDIMLQMNLMEKTSNAGDDYKATHLHLSCEKHFSPTMRPNEKFSPAVKEFFFLQRNNQNIQSMNTYQTSRYIEKYCAEIDENNRVFCTVGSQNEQQVEMKAQFLHNTKIKSS